MERSLFFSMTIGLFSCNGMFCRPPVQQNPRTSERGWCVCRPCRSFGWLAAVPVSIPALSSSPLPCSQSFSLPRRTRRCLREKKNRPL